MHPVFFSSTRPRRNVLCPIANLPIELVRKIFMELVASHTPPLRAPSVNEDNPTWLILELVCKYWQNVVKNYPELHSLPPLPIHRPGCTETAISRSNGRDLFVCIDAVRWSRDTLRLALSQPHLDRLSIDLRCFPNEWHWIHALQPNLCQPFPNLREFKLAGQEYFQVTLYRDVFQDGSIPPPRAVDLTSIWINRRLLKKFMHPALTKLSLANVFIVNDRTIIRKVWNHDHDMVDALKAMLDLEVLSLTDDMLPYTGQEPAERRDPSKMKIHLPRLRTLTLGGLTGEVSRALSFFDIPASTNLSFRIIEGELPEDNAIDNTSLGESVKLVRNIFTSPAFSSRSLVFDTVTITEAFFLAAPRPSSRYVTNAGIRLVVARRPKNDEPGGRPFGPTMVDYSAKYRGSALFHDMLQPLFDALPASVRAARSLAVNHSTFGSDRTAWTHIASVFSKVEMITAHRRSAIYLLEAMCRNARIFPHLRVLRAFNLQMEDTVRWGDRAVLVKEALHWMGKERQNRNLPVFTLQSLIGQPPH